MSLSRSPGSTPSSLFLLFSSEEHSDQPAWGDGRFCRLLQKPLYCWGDAYVELMVLHPQGLAFRPFSLGTETLSKNVLDSRLGVGEG